MALKVAKNGDGRVVTSKACLTLAAVLVALCAGSVLFQILLAPDSAATPSIQDLLLRVRYGKAD